MEKTITNSFHVIAAFLNLGAAEIILVILFFIISLIVFVVLLQMIKRKLR